MKKILILICLSLPLSTGSWAAGKVYEVDKDHSTISFSIRHLVSKVSGTFTDFRGAIELDEKKPETSKVEFTVKAESINTQNAKRDEHLRSPDFFDTEKFKDLTFKSKKVKAIGKNKYQVDGDLTLHGITKPLTLKVDYLGETKDPWGNTKSGFSTTFKINRKDFGIHWNKALDNGGVILGDEVTASIDIEATEKK